MGIHLISVLGTSFYQPIRYGNSENMDKFVQSAMVRMLSSENGLRVTVLVTDKARELNWQDREITERDIEISSRWEESLRWDVEKGNIRLGLESTLKNEFPNLNVRAVVIPDGKNKNEIRGIFNVIYEAIGEGDEIVFDITHSFRSIPMIVVSVLRYAKVMKKCKIKGIYYGAFEAQTDGVAPIIELSQYNEIIEWSFAAEQFTKYGNAAPIKDMYDSLHDGEKSEELGKVVDSMSNLSECIMTSRGSAKGVTNNAKKDKNKYSKSIKQAYEKMSSQDLSFLEKSDNAPLVELINMVRSKYSCLDKVKDYEIGMAVVKLCLEFNLINQGFTALEETIKTYVCNIHDLDCENKKIRENVVALVINSRSRYDVKLKNGEDVRDFATFFTEINPVSKEEYGRICEKKPEFEKIYRTLCKDVSIEFARLSDSIGQCRNDINHFGFNNNIMTAQGFRDKLRELYNATCEEMKVADMKVEN